jgi:undecaprenyl-diphosphatase
MQDDTPDIGTTMLLVALLLGAVEGLTEFIPVSSTGHLILLVDLLGFRGPPGRVFEIFIQLGAISAIVWVYRVKFLRVLFGLTRDPESQRFAANILIAVLPAILIGAVALDFIKEHLFSPWTVSFALIVGGFAILWIERHHPEPTVTTTDEVSLGLALKIGLCQVIAMFPGVSRSGATIMGAMLLGVGRSAATEFSFFLAVPTMIAASGYDLLQNYGELNANDALLLAVGFFSAFVTALLVVRTVIAFVSRRGFAPFAWYRIALGSIMLLVLFTRSG